MFYADGSGIVAANALASCYGTVTLGAGVTRLSEGAFLTASQLTNIKISPSPIWPTDYNTGVTQVVFPSGFTTLDSYSLAGLGAVMYLALPNSLEKILTNTFLRSKIKIIDFSSFQGIFPGSFTITGSPFNYAGAPAYFRDCSVAGTVPISDYIVSYANSKGKVLYCTPDTTATLSALTPSRGSLKQAFSSDFYDYTMTVPNATSSIDFTTTTTVDSAYAYINGLPQINSSNTTFTGGNTVNTILLSAESNTINIIVTAQDGLTSKTYTVTVTRLTYTPPGAPTSVSRTLADASSVISWTAPVSNGGSAITGYTVTSSPAVTAPASCTNTTNLSCEFTGLTNGTAYTFSVVAINAAGNSAASTASASVTPVAPVAPVAPVVVYVPPTPVPYLKTLTNPQIHLAGDKFVCSAGTYNSGYTLDGVIQGSATSLYTPSGYTYNLMFNQVTQSTLAVTTNKNSATWELSAAPAGALVSCSVTVSANSLKNTDSSTANPGLVSAALTTQSQSAAAAENAYNAAVSANSKSYQKALVDNRAAWRTNVDKVHSAYLAELSRINGLPATKENRALKSAALKAYLAAQKKTAVDYKASGPIAMAARDLANKTALEAKNAAISKANSAYGAFIESVGYGVLIP